MASKIVLSLIPGQGAMPIAFGSTREQAGALLLQLGVLRSARHGRSDYYLENSIQIEFTDERASFIGIYPHEDRLTVPWREYSRHGSTRGIPAHCTP